MTHTAAWYDEVMVEPGSPAMLPLEESPWLPVYEEIAALIAPHEEVVDLGCGTGRFMELLYRNGHYAAVTGVDWSHSALDAAQAYVHPRGQFELHIWDLHDWTPGRERQGNAVYVCSEVLEHLENDLALVRNIPPGHRFIFSVPNFDSESHVRTFRNAGDIWRRYDQLLTMKRWIHVGDDLKAIFVCESVRRADSW